MNNKCCEKWKKINGAMDDLKTTYVFCPECGTKLESDRYPMCKDQIVQLDCRLVGCKFNKGGGNCNNSSPAITLNEDRKYTCWSSDYEENEWCECKEPDIRVLAKGCWRCHKPIKPKRKLPEKMEVSNEDDVTYRVFTKQFNKIIDYLND